MDHETFDRIEQPARYRKVRTALAQSALGVLAVTALSLALDAGPSPDLQVAQPAGTKCAVSNGGCPAGVKCFDGPSSAYCGGCPPGFTADGQSCKDIDECATNNGSCGAGVQCSNVPGGWRCGENCPPGFSGTPETGCVDINECSTANGRCDPLTRCRNTPGSRTCTECPKDHVGDGYVGCIDVNELAGQMDTKAPGVTIPGSMTVLATSPDGAVIAFAASAADFTDGEVPVTCTPASGATFPVGTTKVACVAADKKGNRTTATFNVTVMGRK
jgi:hypothetical protein